MKHKNKCFQILKIKIGMSTNHIIQDVFRGVCEINLETMRDWNKTKMSKLS